MKRMLSVILSLLLVCGLGMPAFAAEWYQDIKFGEKLPMYMVTKETEYDWDYEDIMAHKDPSELRTVYRDGELIGQVPFKYRNNDWRFHFEEGDFTAANFAKRYGKDVLVVVCLSERFIVFPDQPNTLYAFSQFADESLSDPVASEFSLTDLIQAAAFLEKQYYIEQEPYRSFQYEGINDQLIQTAADYWQFYEKEGNRQSVIVAICLFGVLAVLASIVIAGLVRMDKKGKLKITNEIVGKFWLPALCKGVTWRLK